MGRECWSARGSDGSAEDLDSQGQRYEVQQSKVPGSSLWSQALFAVPWGADLCENFKAVAVKKECYEKIRSIPKIHRQWLNGQGEAHACRPCLLGWKHLFRRLRRVCAEGAGKCKRQIGDCVGRPQKVKIQQENFMSIIKIKNNWWISHSAGEYLRVVCTQAHGWQKNQPWFLVVDLSDWNYWPRWWSGLSFSLQMTPSQAEVLICWRREGSRIE